MQPGPGKPTDIDQLYGLEPVIEPGDAAGTDAIEPFVGMQCPWCSEFIAMRLDLSAGDQVYIEDCEVCCRPIQVAVQLSGDGTLQALSGERADG